MQAPLYKSKRHFLAVIFFISVYLAQVSVWKDLKIVLVCYTFPHIGLSFDPSLISQYYLQSQQEIWGSLPLQK